MSNQPDYQTAYETLSQAIDQAVSVLTRARMMVDAGLRMQTGEKLSAEELHDIKDRNSPQ